MSKEKIPITAFNFISYCGKWLWARKDNDYFKVKIELLDKKRPGTVKVTFVKYPIGASSERTYDIFYLLSSYEVWASLEEESNSNGEEN